MPNLHVIIGEDDFLVAEAARKVIGDGIGLEVIDSNTSTNEDLQLRDLAAARESYMTPPFFDPRKVTWWKNVRFLPGGGRGKGDGEEGGKVSEAVKGGLLDFANLLAKGGLPENQHFILSGPKLLMTSVFAKTLSRVAEVIVYEKPKRPSDAVQDAVARVMDRAADMGMTFAIGASERFVARVGVDTRSLISELQKLRDYIGGGGKATADDVDAISSPGVGVEPVIWQVTDAISGRDLSRCLVAVRQFEGEKNFAVMMTTVVERHFRQMVEMKDAADRGKFDAATAGLNPWAARKMAESLRNWSLSELRTARMRFLNLRERCVISGGNAGDAVVIELVRALRRPIRTRGR